MWNHESIPQYYDTKHDKVPHDFPTIIFCKYYDQNVVKIYSLLISSTMLVVRYFCQLDSLLNEKNKKVIFVKKI